MGDLGLQAQAEKQFAFLLQESGYRCVVSTPYRVRFESSKANVDIVFDGNRSYELTLLLSRARLTGAPPASFTIDEVLRLRGAPEAAHFSLVQVTTPQKLAEFVAQFANLLRRYGRDVVAGDDDAFRDLAEQRSQEAEAYGRQRDVRVARAKAQIAWREKNYAGVVEALRPVRSTLTASEIRKLEFAERHR
jgi:hypothetical protein